MSTDGTTLNGRHYIVNEPGETIRWHDPRMDPPPIGAKLVAYTRGGVVVTGPWHPEYLAWHPLLRTPAWLRQRLSDAYYGDQPVNG